MKELIERLRMMQSASEFLCLSDLYGKMHEERVEAADALERLTAENDGHKISITCYQAQVDDLTAERDALRADAERKDSLLLWALYHHQGSGSPIGKPIRRALGLGQFDALSAEQVAKAIAIAGEKHD